MAPLDFANWLYLHGQQEWAVMTGAPIAFVSAVVVSGAAIWLLVRAHFQQEIRALKAQLNVKDERLKQRDEAIRDAQMRIVALEPSARDDQRVHLGAIEKLLARQQRIVTADQYEAATKVLRQIPQIEPGRETADQKWRTFCVVTGSNDPEAERYAEDLAQIFRDAGCFDAIGKDPNLTVETKGVIIRIRHHDVTPPMAQFLSKALWAAKIEHKTAEVDLSYEIPVGQQCELVVGRNG